MWDVDAAECFELRRVSATEWVIHDRRFAADDARSVVACVWQDEDDGVGVVWLDGRAMPSHYASVDAVMDDVATSALRRAGGTRPIEIPHLPPPRLAG